MLKRILSGKSIFTFTLISLGLYMFSCTTFLDEQRYDGPPHSLKYMSISDYYIGDDYITVKPTVMGGELATYRITNIEGPAPEEVLTESFSINEQQGNINIKEFNNLSIGTYSLDVEVKNTHGSTIFENAFSFSAKQAVPTEVRYTPSIYSFYGHSQNDVTNKASVNGGGPYAFSMNDPLNHFSINETDGVITKDAIIEIGDDEKIIKSFDVGVSNELGSYLAQDAVVIEIIGANINPLVYNMEYSTPNISSLGLLNGIASTYIGEVTEELDGEEYTVNLTEGVNGPIYKGNRHQNTWHAQASNIVLDESGDGQTSSELFLSFKTSSSKTECISIVVSDSINLSESTSAYTEIKGYKRFIDNDVNQRFELLICSEDSYNTDDVFESDWQTVNANFAPGMLPYANPIKESSLTNDGTQEFDIPSEFLGTKVRLAIKAVHLNPSLGNLGREAFIYKWQIRAK